MPFPEPYKATTYMSLDSIILNTPSSPVQVSVDELLTYRQLAISIRMARKRIVASERVGEMQSRILGRGLDFSELREYQPGDDIRQIDWNVTARTGKPHTKLFSLERERPYFVVLDLRSGMKFATRNAYKSVVASRLAAILAWTAVLANDRVGGLVFSDTTHLEIKPENGRRGLIKLFRAIVATQSKTSEHSELNNNALSDAVSRLARLAHTGSTIWFFSDFDGFDQRARSQFAGLMQHNEVNAIQLTDVLESELPPPGHYRLIGRNSGVQIDTRNPRSRQHYHQQYMNRQQELRRHFCVGRHYYTRVFTDDKLDQCAIDVLRHRLDRSDTGESDESS